MPKADLVFRLIATIGLAGSALASASPRPSLSCDRRLLKASTIAFRSHASPQPGASYLAMTLDYPPAKAIFDQLSARVSRPLKSRGEAHVTVITPIEVAALAAHVSPQEIDQIARDFDIQSSALTPICIGRGEAKLDGQLEQTYFIVVQAPHLLQIRQKIAQLFQARGGATKAFVASDFHPHITLGFTRDDLHAKDGVIKDSASCLYNLNM